jgi:hypothetical protein
VHEQPRQRPGDRLGRLVAPDDVDERVLRLGRLLREEDLDFALGPPFR